MASKNIPVNGWPQLKDLEVVQPTLDRLDKIEAWKKTVKEETFTGDDFIIPNALKLPARSLKTTIEAIQDLHGYDHPWAGGADVNKFDISSATMTGYISVFGLTVAKDNDGYITITGTYTGENSVPKFAIIPTLPLLNNAVFYLMDKNAAANTNVIQCRWSNPSTGGVAIDLQNMVQNQTYNIKFRLMIVTDGTTPTSFRPYSNICPISGRTEARVDTNSEQLLNISSLRGIKSSVTTTGNTIRVTATEAGTWVYAIADNIPVDPNKGTITYGCKKLVESKAANDGQLSIAFYDANNAFISRTNYGGDLIKTVSIPSNAVKVSVNVFVSLDVSAAVGDYVEVSGLYLSYGYSSATIQLGTTVYGAEINWDTGVATVLWAAETFDGSEDESWDMFGSGSASAYAMITTLANACKYTSQGSVPPIKANYLYAIANHETWGNYDGFMSFAVSDLEKALVTGIKSITSVSAWKTYLASNPLQVCYELSTPTTLQLTPTQLQMLKGYNHITLADGYGTIELKALTGANWS